MGRMEPATTTKVENKPERDFAMTTITMKEIRSIKNSADMINYISSKEQAEYWFNLVTKKHVIPNASRTKKDGTKNDVCRKLTFEVARKRYFDKFYQIVEESSDKRQSLESDAAAILAMFA